MRKENNAKMLALLKYTWVAKERQILHTYEYFFTASRNKTIYIYMYIIFKIFCQRPKTVCVDYSLHRIYEENHKNLRVLNVWLMLVLYLFAGV